MLYFTAQVSSTGGLNKHKNFLYINHDLLVTQEGAQTSIYLSVSEDVKTSGTMLNHFQVLFDGIDWFVEFCH